MKVFVDTGAWLALEIKNDVNHLAAKKFLYFLQRKRALLYTNPFVLSETYTRLIYDVSLFAAKKFHENILQGTKSNLTILEIDKTEREFIWEQLFQYRDHKLSYTDVSITVCYKNYQLDTIFTFDSHFRNINLSTNLV